MAEPNSNTSSTTSKYKYPVYRADDRPPRFSSAILKEMMDKMKEDELWEELKNLYESED
ncbi:MAG: hypothetical protein PVF58_06875 [Candidatus Methanofastidiosia archaeon]|jgi:hypothetical protein